jgi:hypothetical protein
MHARNDRNRSTAHDSQAADQMDPKVDRDWILNAIEELEDPEDEFEEMLRNDSIGG